jgi:hypothetical protein
VPLVVAFDDPTSIAKLFRQPHPFFGGHIFMTGDVLVVAYIALDFGAAQHHVMFDAFNDGSHASDSASGVHILRMAMWKGWRLPGQGLPALSSWLSMSFWEMWPPAPRWILRQQMGHL